MLNFSYVISQQGNLTSLCATTVPVYGCLKQCTASAWKNVVAVQLAYMNNTLCSGTLNTGLGLGLWVYSEKSIPAYGPALPNPCEFYDHDKFREFLITKILNGEKAAFRNQTFSEKRFRTMDTLLKDMYIKYLNSAPIRKASSPKTSSENDNGHRPSSKIGNRTPQDQQAVKEFLLVGEVKHWLQVFLAVLLGNPHESCVQTNLLYKQPWEPDLLYSDLPKMDIISSDSWDNNSLVCVTELNGVLLIKDKGSILLMDNYCFVQQVRIVENFDLLLVRCEKGKDAYLSAFSLQYVRSVIRASKSLTKKDCCGQKISGSKGCHVFSMTGNDSFRLTLALCTGRKLSIYRARMKNQQIFDSNIMDFFELIREINCNEEPFKMSIFESGLHADIKIAILAKSDLSILTIEDSSSITVYRPTNTKIARESSLIVSSDLDTEDILLTSQSKPCMNYNPFEFSENQKNSTLIFDLFENDFSSPLSITWTNNPSSVAYCFPFILAFGSDTIEIRLGVNGNLFASLSMAGVSLLASKEDIFFVTTGESGDGKCGPMTIVSEPKVRVTKSSLPASFLTSAAMYPKPKCLPTVKCSFYKISVKNLLKGGRTSSSHSKATTSASSHGSETKTSFGDSFSASISPGSCASNIGSSSSDCHRVSDDSQYYQFDKPCFVSYKPDTVRLAKPSTDLPIDLMNRVSINSDSGLSFESNMNEEDRKLCQNLGQRQLQMNQVPHFGPKDECQNSQIFVFQILFLGYWLKQMTSTSSLSNLGGILFCLRNEVVERSEKRISFHGQLATKDDELKKIAAKIIPPQSFQQVENPDSDGEVGPHDVSKLDYYAIIMQIY
uniref:CNH domain-containing protein n=1 Tax=Romanomermis culicivorax TaxID=13658 RepID=A0A915KRP0_ROMCU